MAESVSLTTQGTPSYIHHLILLDKNVNNAENQSKLERLSEIDEKLRTFTSDKQCFNYLNELNERNTVSYVIFIISAGFSEEIISKLEKYLCILAIFISCTESERKNQLESDMVTICTNTNQLIHRILGCISRDTISMHYKLMKMPNEIDTGKNEGQRRIGNFKEDEAHFLWFYKCHRFMVSLNDDDEQAKIDMLKTCTKLCGDSQKELKFVKKFQEQSIDDNAENAIYFYTNDSIVIRSMNDALASGDIERIYTYRYLIKLICRQLNDFHKKYTKSIEKEQLRVYRGQVLKLSDILNILAHRNDLISFNNFLSTTLEKDIAKKFCNGRRKADHEPVIFQIDIDLTSKQSTPFADIMKWSRYESEEEILFSVGSVFRINSVELNEDSGFYYIYLSLNRHDQLAVNDYIEHTYPNEASSSDLPVLFGKLLFDMEKYRFAITYYKDRLENLSDVDIHHRPTYMNNLGACYNAIGKKDEALNYYKMAQQIYAYKNNNRGLGTCYHNIASYHYDQRNYNDAMKYSLEALKRQIDCPLEKAATLDLLGNIQLANGDITAASDSFQQALNIRLLNLKTINPNHPDIGISYQNIGKIDSKSSSYDNAKQNYQRAEQIFRCNFHSSHSLMIDITKRLADIGRRLGN